MQGGMAIHTNSLSSATHVLGDPGQVPNQSEHDLEFEDITPVLITVGATAFMLISIYMRPTIGLSGVNLHRLAVLAALLSTFCIPWLAVGDWNVDPEVMA